MLAWSCSLGLLCSLGPNSKNVRQLHKLICKRGGKIRRVVFVLFLWKGSTCSRVLLLLDKTNHVLFNCRDLEHPSAGVALPL